MTRKEVDDVFQEYGAYATGKDYALVHAIAKAVASQRQWVRLTDEEEFELDEKYGDDFNVYIDQRDLKLKEKNT